MSKTLPLRCDSCKQIVGSVKAVDETDLETEFVDGDMKLDQHLEDCPVLKMFLDENMSLYSVEINSGDH